MIGLSDVQWVGLGMCIAGGVIWVIGAGMMAIRKDERKRP